jgi:hypothetical protein
MTTGYLIATIGVSPAVPSIAAMEQRRVGVNIFNLGASGDLAGDAKANLCGVSGRDRYGKLPGHQTGTYMPRLLKQARKRLRIPPPALSGSG